MYVWVKNFVKNLQVFFKALVSIINKVMYVFGIFSERKRNEF